MSGFAILMFIFGGCTFLVGLYMATGHKVGMLAWRAGFKGLTREGWKKVGWGTLIASGVIFLIAIVGWIFNFQ